MSLYYRVYCISNLYLITQKKLKKYINFKLRNL